MSEVDTLGTPVSKYERQSAKSLILQPISETGNGRLPIGYRSILLCSEL